MRYRARVAALPAGLARPRPTFDRRFWVVATAATVGTLLMLGIPTAVIPNPLFTRMTATEPASMITWLVSAPLIGLVVATDVARPAVGDPHLRMAEWRASAGSIGAILAIGCPICNKIVVGLLGVTGALNIYAPTLRSSRSSVWFRSRCLP
jgi:hypothetical protein